MARACAYVVLMKQKINKHRLRACIDPIRPVIRSASVYIWDNVNREKKDRYSRFTVILPLILRILERACAKSVSAQEGVS